MPSLTLGAMVAEINGVSARRMIQGLIAGKDPMALAGLGLGALRAKQDEPQLALDGEPRPATPLA